MERDIQFIEFDLPQKRQSDALLGDLELGERAYMALAWEKFCPKLTITGRAYKAIGLIAR